MQTRKTTARRPAPSLVPANLDPLPSMDRANHVAAADGLGEALSTAARHHKTLADANRDLTQRLEREREQHSQSIAAHIQEMQDAQEAHDVEFREMREDKDQQIAKLTAENKDQARRIAAFAEKAARAVSQAQEALDYAHTQR